MSNVEFPRFYDKDVQGWIYKCEQFFKVDETPVGSRVKIVAIHLEGKAFDVRENTSRLFQDDLASNILMAH